MATLSLGRRRKFAHRTGDRTDLLHVAGSTIAKIKKGTPKQKLIDKNTGKPRLDNNGNEILKQGKDLNTHFRFAPTDKEVIVTDYGAEGENDEATMAEIFERIYTGEPNHIPVNVLGFDHLVHYDFSHEAGKERARKQLQRWGVAYVRNASGSLLVETDITCSWVTKERGEDGYLHPYEPGEKEVEVHLNEKGCVGYNSKLDEGKECYLHKGRLMPWSYVGRLHLFLPEFNRRAGVVGNIIFETRSVIDVEQIVDDLMGILEMVEGKVRLSNIPLILYRKPSDVAVPGYGKGHLNERRSNRVKKVNWGAHIRMDNRFVSKALELQQKIADDHIAALLSAPRQESIAEINAALYPDGADTSPQRALPAPEPDFIEYDEEVDYDDVDYDDDIEEVMVDGEFEYEPSCRERIAGAAEAKLFTDYCMKAFGINNKECKERLAALGITGPSVRAKRNRTLHFIRMCVYHDFSDTITDHEAMIAKANEEADRIAKEYTS